MGQGWGTMPAHSPDGLCVVRDAVCCKLLSSHVDGYLKGNPQFPELAESEWQFRSSETAFLG